MRVKKVVISLVVPTYNRAALLKKCLESIEQQLIDKDCFEVVIVNDGSTDETEEIVRSIINKNLIDCKCLFQANSGVSVARNRGICEAVGDVIAFTDDDCIVPKNWVESMMRCWAATGDDVAGIGGPLNTVTDNPNLFISQYLAYIDEFNHVPVVKAGFIRPVHVSKIVGNEVIPYLRTSNASFRKSCLLEVGGFATVFRRPGGEDPDLCYRLLAKGYRFQFEPSLVVDHNSRESMTAYFNSLGNYVRGDLIKSRKKLDYPENIRGSYRFILLQKFVSFLIKLVAFPFSMVKKFFNPKGKFSFCVLFPFVDIAAKMYALTIAFSILKGKKHRIVSSGARLDLDQ